MICSRPQLPPPAAVSLDSVFRSQFFLFPRLAPPVFVFILSLLADLFFQLRDAPDTHRSSVWALPLSPPPLLFPPLFRVPPAFYHHPWNSVIQPFLRQHRLLSSSFLLSGLSPLLLRLCLKPRLDSTPPSLLLPTPTPSVSLSPPTCPLSFDHLVVGHFYFRPLKTNRSDGAPVITFVVRGRGLTPPFNMYLL